MKIFKRIFVSLLTLVTVSFCSQKKETQGEKFLKFLNDFQVDSLSRITSYDFTLTRTFTSRKSDKFLFLNEYVQKSKAYNGRFLVQKRLTTKNPEKFLVVDESEYLKYLGVKFPTWTIAIKTDKNNLIESMIIDTTDTYQEYIKKVTEMNKIFENWLTQKYPQEKISTLSTDTSGLLIKRAKEFSIR